MVFITNALHYSLSIPLLKSFQFHAKFTLYSFQNYSGNLISRFNLARLSSSSICHAFVEFPSEINKNDNSYRPNHQTYLWLLEGWINSSSGSLIDCRKIHGLIVKSGFVEEIELNGRLLDLYLVNDHLWDAHNVFDEMLERGVNVCVSSWNKIIAGFAAKKLSREAFGLFTRMLGENVDPDEFTFSNVLRAYGGGLGEKIDLCCIEQIHVKIIVFGFDGSRFVCNPLIDLYSKSGMIDSAKFVFDNLGDRDSVSWVAMMSGLSQNGCEKQCIRLFCDEMHAHGILPTPYALSSVLSACSKTEAFELGQQLHGLIYKWGFASEVYVCNACVTLYSRMGDSISAGKVFEKMKHKDGVSYNSLISGLAQKGLSDQAVHLLQKMQRDFIKPDCVTVASLVSACATIGSLDKGRQLHSYALKAGFCSDMLIEGSLLDLYVKCSDIETAHKYFLTTKKENVVLWNVMLVAYGQAGNLSEAYQLFSQMQMKGLEPNQYTYPSMLRSCTSVGAVDLGGQIHTQVIKTGFQLNEYVCSVLMDMYAKHGFLDTAEKIFERLTGNDVVSWTVMIAAYGQYGKYVHALKLFEEMLYRGIQVDNIGLSSAMSACAGIQALYQGRQIHAQSYILGYSDDLSIRNALVSLYARCGRLREAYQAFEKIDVKDNISWNALISGFAQSGHSEDSLRVYTHMNEAGVEANLFTYSSSISAAANIANVKEGKQIQAKLFKTGYNLETETSNALITLYAKCGCLDDARRVFSEIINRNEVTWNAMITGYSQHGCGEEALEIFDEMKRVGVVPNYVSFVGVLSACSHVGLVEQGLEYFESMSKEYNLVPKLEHHVCVVDILGRAGFLGRARKFIEDMQIEPDAMIWRTLLRACIVHKNKETGEFAARCLLELEPDDSATYVLMSNMYAVTRNWTCMDDTRKMMKEKGVKKEPGRSWIEVKNCVHAFYAGDNLHPLADKIYNFLDNLNERVAKIGYIQDQNSLLVDLEKSKVLNVHSERLAIAFGLISSSSSIPLRVMKNLRVCADCHNWIKSVSKISNRTIIVRDAYRFHHFEGGSCSCKDYW
ncbi:pentatricopeptide repeat-containing protein At4g13650 [Beta vulgaris subsp. vulgaris]|uniref:pentatricopeptide repeat-containing protein At4g13650 n=1 Tax=Beta vulgaris subsp. vulgaris TaxID=3555 RepID=UPI00203676BC|nr:pentatricopeptide repeat-containing protein At4g13650 [Beta vulgaris subsp. vulgaris]